MDSVRFGRALGKGARLAGRTLVEAVDAATAPDPRAGTPGAARPAGTRPQADGVVMPRARSATATVGTIAAREVKNRGRGVAQGSRRFGEAMWGPLAKASGVLWLEVTGLFFGLIALYGVQGVWGSRMAYSASGNPTLQKHLMLSGGLLLVFGYFCVSSFVKASRKNKGKG
jgi:hypothetical protein